MLVPPRDRQGSQVRSPVGCLLGPLVGLAEPRWRFRCPTGDPQRGRPAPRGPARGTGPGSPFTAPRSVRDRSGPDAAARLDILVVATVGGDVLEGVRAFPAAAATASPAALASRPPSRLDCRGRPVPESCLCARHSMPWPTSRGASLSCQRGASDCGTLLALGLDFPPRVVEMPVRPAVVDLPQVRDDLRAARRPGVLFTSPPGL